METDNPCSINPLCDKGIFHNKDSKKRSYGPHLYVCMFQESISYAWRALQMNVAKAVISWTIRTCNRMTVWFELDIGCQAQIGDPEPSSNYWQEWCEGTAIVFIRKNEIPNGNTRLKSSPSARTTLELPFPMYMNGKLSGDTWCYIRGYDKTKNAIESQQ